MNTLSFGAVDVVLIVPLTAAGILALLPSYPLAARLNVVATFVTMIAALSLFVARPEPGAYILVDDLNIVFIALSTFVGFTTSVFSASYVEHEVEIGRLTPANYDVAVEIASVPERIRGYGHIKRRHLTEIEPKQAELLAAFDVARPEVVAAE